MAAPTYKYDKSRPPPPSTPLLAGDVHLLPGDEFAIVNRVSGKEANLSRSVDCMNHRFQVTKGWAPTARRGVMHALATCLDCSVNRNVRNVVTRDLIKNVRFFPPPITYQATLTIEETSNMFQTYTVETIKGWVGQVKFEGKIVWESEAFPGEPVNDNGEQPAADKAMQAATKAKQDAVQALFATQGA